MFKYDYYDKQLKITYMCKNFNRIYLPYNYLQSYIDKLIPSCANPTYLFLLLTCNFPAQLGNRLGHFAQLTKSA